MSKDYLFEKFMETCNKVISTWREEGISDTEIIERISQDRLKNTMWAALNQATSDIHNFFVEKQFEIAHKQRIEEDKFLAHHNEIWGGCFATSEVMYVMAVEAAEAYSKFVSENIPEAEWEKKQYTFLVLQYMHGRCCQEYLEILHLMRFGFADCAYARWRSMYELACNASFVVKHGERIARQYFDQAQTADYKYGWTKGAKKDDGSELKVQTFQGIQDNCNVRDEWRKQYKLACLVNHGSPQGTFKRMCLGKSQRLLVVGQSDYGITTPAEHSAVCLSWISCMFLSVFPCMDAMAHIKVIDSWVEEIRKSYFKTADECFGTNFHYTGEDENEEEGSDNWGVSNE